MVLVFHRPLIHLQAILKLHTPGISHHHLQRLPSPQPHNMLYVHPLPMQIRLIIATFRRISVSPTNQKILLVLFLSGSLKFEKNENISNKLYKILLLVMYHCM